MSPWWGRGRRSNTHHIHTHTQPVTRIDSAPNDPAQWVPCSVIKPVVEAVETFLSQVFGGPEIKVRIKLVNDALEPQHGKQSGRESWEVGEGGGGSGSTRGNRSLLGLTQDGSRGER